MKTCACSVSIFVQKCCSKYNYKYSVRFTLYREVVFKPDCCTFVHISAAFNCVYFSSYRRTFCARCFWCLLITRGVLFAAYNITATPFTYFPLFLERTEKFFVWRHCGNKLLLTNFRDTDAQNVIFRINTFCGLFVYFQECLFV